MRWSLFFLIMLSSLQASWAAVTPSYGGELTRAYAGEVRTLDPLHAYTSVEIEIARLLYSRLTRIASDGEVKLDLAASMEVLENGLLYRFRVDPGAHFHDDSPVTAADVRFSLERLVSASPPVRGRWLLTPVKGSRGDWEGVLPTIEGIRLRGLDTIDILLERPVPDFPRMLARTEASIVSRLVERKRELGTKELRPIGSGPFAYHQTASSGSRIVLRSFKGHHRGKPYINLVRYNQVRDTKSRLLSVTYRGADLTSFSLSELDRTTLSEKSVRDVEAPGQLVTFLGIGRRIPEEDRPWVKSLLQKGIDIQSIMEVILKGQGRPALGFLDREQTGIEMLENEGYDPAGAGKIALKLAMRRQTAVELVLTYPEFLPDLLLVAERIQANLTRTGLAVKLAPADRDGYVSAIKTGDYDLLVAKAESCNQPVDFMAFYNEWVEPLTLDKIAGAGMSVTGAGVLQEMESMVESAGAVLFLYKEPKIFAVKPAVKGFSFDGEGYPQFEECWVSP